MSAGWRVPAAAGVLGLAGLWALGRPDADRRGFEVFTEMAYSQAAEAYSPSEVFADGRTLQPLQPGVVAAGRLPFPYGAGPDEAKRAGAELASPVAAGDAAALAEGGRLYGISCVPCHDARGNGKGKVVLRGMLPPPSLHGDRARAIADGEIFHILTRGQGNMPAYAGQLSEHERWLVIAHVRKLQQEGP
jgi:mono/diheme cytochrome c family protein